MLLDLRKLNANAAIHRGSIHRIHLISSVPFWTFNVFFIALYHAKRENQMQKAAFFCKKRAFLLTQTSVRVIMTV
jgi:hypothetical protein